MGTTASISKLNDDGSVSSIFCNFDGYLSWTGETLKKYYKTPGYVDKLLSHGDIRCLDKSIQLTKEITECNNIKYDKRTTYFVDWQDYENHGCREDYNYMYCDGEWTVKPYGDGNFNTF